MLQSAGACATRAVCIYQLFRPGLLLWCIRGGEAPDRPPRKLNEPSRRNSLTASARRTLQHRASSRYVHKAGRGVGLGDVVAGKTFGLNTDHSGLLVRTWPRWVHVYFKQIEPPCVWHARTFASRGPWVNRRGPEPGFHHRRPRQEEPRGWCSRPASLLRAWDERKKHIHAQPKPHQPATWFRSPRLGEIQEPQDGPVSALQERAAQLP